jgi:uncharacterized protein YoxC
MSWMPQSWEDWAAFTAVAAFVGTLLYFSLRAKLGGDFFTRDKVMQLHNENVGQIEGLHKDHRDMVHRLSNLEQKFLTLPTREDVRRTEDKVGELSTNIAGLSASVRGLVESGERTFTQLQLLTRAQLQDKDR